MHAHKQKHMHSIENRIKIDANELHYKRIFTEASQADSVLVFLHDSWGCVETWGDFPELISQSFGMDALLYDRCEYGKSSAMTGTQSTDYHYREADELMLLLDKLKIAKVILYGHSDGGTIAIVAAATYPERISAIIVETPHTFVETEGKNAVKKVIDKAASNSLLKKLEKYHGEKTEAMFQFWYQTWLSKDFDNWTLEPILGQIKCPVLAMRGKDDPFDTEKQLEILKFRIESPLMAMLVPMAGHTPRKENAEATFAYIHDFFIQHINI